MANRLRQVTCSALPFASLLALAIGPAAAAAEAHYALHAWTAKSEAAAKSRTTDSGTKSEGQSQSRKDHSNERTLSSFFAPASAKPSDTQSKSGGPVIDTGRTLVREFAAPAGPAVAVFIETAKQLHRPSHQANAPPFA